MVHTRVMPWTCKIFGLIYFSLELRSVYETIAGGVLVRSSEFRIQSDRRSSTSEVKFAIIKYGRTEHGFLSLYYYHHNIGPSDFFGNAIEQSWKCLICISVERRQWPALVLEYSFVLVLPQKLLLYIPTNLTFIKRYF